MYRQIHRLISHIRNEERSLANITDAQLREKSLGLKYKVMSGVRLDRILVSAFAMVGEAVFRVFGYRLHDVQLMGGFQLQACRIAEMKTGEGKTVTATLPAYVHSLSGKGVHVLTVNDYLASRDQASMEPVYSKLGVTSAVIGAEDNPQSRALAYRKEITYASVKELGFDFLRDRLSKDKRKSNGVVPSLYFCLIDEADSILMDEARVPLIIGIHDMEDKELMDGCYRWAIANSHAFVESIDYVYDRMRQRVDLTYRGRAYLREISSSIETSLVPIKRLAEVMQTALKVDRDIIREKQYDVIEGKVVIIDEYTGRPAEGRQWQDGIHQLVEARERLEISPPTRAAAMITIQDLFSRYPKMAGMTGTAISARREFKKAHRKSVVAIPCNRPVIRRKHPTLVFPTFAEKISEVVHEVQNIISSNRAVLIGTRSVEVSETVSKALAEKQIVHQVLNSRNLPREARIIERAGRIQAVTVATNMAGRGTDIKLNEIVRGNGGLHVILTEIHDSKRIDWQLIGRGSRQGDPGSYRIFLSAEDEILKIGLNKKQLSKVQRLVSQKAYRKAVCFFDVAQRNIEKKHLIDRLILLRQSTDRYKALSDTGQDPLLV